MNGIWNRHISPNLRIMINNNGGGGIFDTLPGLNNSTALNEFITAEHSTSAKNWTKQQGFIYLTANNEDDLKKHLPTFLSNEITAPVVLEVFTSIDTNSKEIKSFYQQQRN